MIYWNREKKGKYCITYLTDCQVKNEKIQFLKKDLCYCKLTLLSEQYTVKIITKAKKSILYYLKSGAIPV